MSELEERLSRIVASWPFTGRSAFCLGCSKHADYRLYIGWVDEGKEVSVHIGALAMRAGGKFGFGGRLPNTAIVSFKDIADLVRVSEQMEIYLQEFLETDDCEKAFEAALA